jgi:AcrR family transcriptional regulator
MNTTTRLTKIDWVQAGFRALTQRGLPGIKAESIARDLNVSKGSFYWHFKNINALKVSMLEHWQESATQDVIEYVLASDHDPKQQLRNLLIMSTDTDISTPYGGDGAEAAIREWARTSEEVEAVVLRVDATRLEFVSRLLVAAGQPKDLAMQHANLIYSSLIGLQQLSIQDSVKPQRDLLHLLALVLA